MIGPQKDAAHEDTRKDSRPSFPYSVHMDDEIMFISSVFSKLRIGISRTNPLDVSAFRGEEVPDSSSSSNMESSSKNTTKYAVEYVVGICEIESIPLLVVVTKSDEVHHIDTLIILKIAEVAFIPVSHQSAPTQSESKNEFEEQKDRMASVLTHFGYYCLLSNISASFYSITRQHFARVTSQRGNNPINSLINDQRKSQAFSFNYRLVREIEDAANSPLWEFDVIVGTVTKLKFENRDILLVARRITTPASDRGKYSANDAPKLGAIRHDGYTSKFCEIELIEKRGDTILTKVIQKGSLNLHLNPLDEKRQRLAHLISHLQGTQGNFNRVNIVHTDEKRVASQLLKEDMDDPEAYETDGTSLMSEEGSVNYQAIKQAIEAKVISKNFSLTLMEDLNNMELNTAVKLLRTTSQMKPNVVSVNISQAAEQSFGDSCDYTRYSLVNHNLGCVQNTCVRAENLTMSERVDIFIMLHIVEAIYKFSHALAGTNSLAHSGGIAGSDQKLTPLEQEVAFFHKFLKDSRCLKYLTTVFENLSWVLNQMPSDLTAVFSGEKWTRDSIIQIPEQVGIDIDKEVKANFSCYEQIVNTWEARRGLAGNLTSEISSPTIKSKLVTMSITWNVEGFSPKSEEPIRGLFSHVLENRPHLIFISLQEVFECKPHNWTKIMNNSISSQECQTWKNVLSKVLGAIDPTFKLLAAECLGALMLLVFSKVPQELFTEQVKFTKNSLGYMGGMMANKAALTCAFRVRDCRIHVMGCHLASGESESSNSNRVSQLFQVLPGVVEGTYEAGNKTGIIGSGVNMVAGLFGGLTGSKTKPVIKPELKPTVLFAMGDMNFRVAKPYLECMRVLNTIKQSKLKGSELQEQIDYMLEKDQLRLAMRKVAGLKNLRESRISFLPTYKLEKQEDLYDTEKQRTPSWTDRVLTYAEENDYLVPLEYSSITSVHNSDHRPVYLIAEVRITKLPPKVF